MASEDLGKVSEQLERIERLLEGVTERLDTVEDVLTHFNATSVVFERKKAERAAVRLERPAEPEASLEPPPVIAIEHAPSALTAVDVVLVESVPDAEPVATSSHEVAPPETFVEPIAEPITPRFTEPIEVPTQVPTVTPSPSASSYNAPKGMSEREYKIGAQVVPYLGGGAVILGILFAVTTLIARGMLDPVGQFLVLLIGALGLSTLGVVMVAKKETYGQILAGVGSASLYAIITAGMMRWNLYQGPVLITLLTLLSLANLAFSLWRSSKPFFAIGLLGGLACSFLPTNQGDVGVGLVLELIIVAACSILLWRNRWTDMALPLWAASTVACLPLFLRDDLRFATNPTLKTGAVFLYTLIILAGYARSFTPVFSDKNGWLAPVALLSAALMNFIIADARDTFGGGAAIVLALTAWAISYLAVEKVVRRSIWLGALLTACAIGPMGLKPVPGAFTFAIVAIVLALVPRLENVLPPAASDFLVSTARWLSGLIAGMAAIGYGIAIFNDPANLPAVGVEASMLVALIIALLFAISVLPASVLTKKQAASAGALICVPFALRLFFLLTPHEPTGLNTAGAIALDLCVLAAFTAGIGVLKGWKTLPVIASCQFAVSCVAYLAMFDSPVSLTTEIFVACVLVVLSIGLPFCFSGPDRKLSPRAFFLFSIPFWLFLTRIGYLTLTQTAFQLQGPLAAATAMFFGASIIAEWSRRHRWQLVSLSSVVYGAVATAVAFIAMAVGAGALDVKFALTPGQSVYAPFLVSVGVLGIPWSVKTCVRRQEAVFFEILATVPLVLMGTRLVSLLLLALPLGVSPLFASVLGFALCGAAVATYGRRTSQPALVYVGSIYLVVALFLHSVVVSGKPLGWSDDSIATLGPLFAVFTAQSAHAISAAMSNPGQQVLLSFVLIGTALYSLVSIRSVVDEESKDGVVAAHSVPIFLLTTHIFYRLIEAVLPDLHVAALVAGSAGISAIIVLAVAHRLRLRSASFAGVIFSQLAAASYVVVFALIQAQTATVVWWQDLIVAAIVCGTCSYAAIRLRDLLEGADQGYVSFVSISVNLTLARVVALSCTELLPNIAPRMLGIWGDSIAAAALMWAAKKTNIRPASFVAIGSVWICGLVYFYRIANGSFIWWQDLLAVMSVCAASIYVVSHLNELMPEKKLQMIGWTTIPVSLALARIAALLLVQAWPGVHPSLTGAVGFALSAAVFGGIAFAKGWSGLAVKSTFMFACGLVAYLSGWIPNLLVSGVMNRGEFIFGLGALLVSNLICGKALLAAFSSRTAILAVSVLLNWVLSANFVGLILSSPAIGMGYDAAVSVAWTMYGGVLMAIGFVAKESVLRYWSFGVFGATVVKFVLYDLAALDMAIKALILICIGGVLLAIGLAYARSRKAG